MGLVEQLRTWDEQTNKNHQTITVTVALCIYAFKLQTYNTIQCSTQQVAINNSTKAIHNSTE